MEGGEIISVTSNSLFCFAISGCPSFSKPGCFPLSTQILNASSQYWNTRICVDLDHSRYYIFNQDGSFRTHDVCVCGVLDIWLIFISACTHL